MKSNVMCKISCKNCELYGTDEVGRTVPVKSRITKHRNHMRNTSTCSVIIDHRLQEDYEFDWENVAILNEEEKDWFFGSVIYRWRSFSRPIFRLLTSYKCRLVLISISQYHPCLETKSFCLLLSISIDRYLIPFFN